MKLADKLVCLRKKQGLSQLKLAEIMNVSLDYLFDDSADELDETENTPVETKDNKRQSLKKRKTKWVIVLCFLLLAVAIYISVRVGARSKSEQIKGLPNEEVDIVFEDGFDIN